MIHLEPQLFENTRDKEEIFKEMLETRFILKYIIRQVKYLTDEDYICDLYEMDMSKQSDSKKALLLADSFNDLLNLINKWLNQIDEGDYDLFHF